MTEEDRKVCEEYDNRRYNEIYPNRKCKDNKCQGPDCDGQHLPCDFPGFKGASGWVGSNDPRYKESVGYAGKEGE